MLCTATATLAAKAELFGLVPERSGARVTIRLVPGAWALFHAGDHAGYAELIARDAEASRADVVALAQASMAPAARLTARPVLTVPAAALAAVLAQQR